MKTLVSINRGVYCFCLSLCGFVALIAANVLASGIDVQKIDVQKTDAQKSDTEVQKTQSFESLVNSNYQFEPGVVIDAYEQLSHETISQMTPDMLVKVSYAAAITANFDLTLQLTDLLLEKATALNDEVLVGQAHYNRGAAFAISGNHDLSLDALLLALASLEHSQNEKQKARIKAGLALIYVEIGEYQLAKPYFEEALLSHRARNDEANISMVLHNRAFMKVLELDYDAAKQDLLESLTICRKLGMKSTLPVIYKNLGKIETEIGNREAAVAYFEQAMEEARQSQLMFHQSEILQEYARLHIRNKEFSEAENKLNQSIEIGKEYGLLKQIKNSYLILATIYSQMENYKAAFLAYEKATATAEKMGESHIATNLSRLERYTTSLKEQNQRLVLEKEKEIAVLAAERQYLLRNFLIAIAGIAVLLTIYVIRRLVVSKQQAVIFEKQSKIDSLTGVWNRRAGEAQLSRLCSRDSMSLKVFSIAMLDIDYFKQVNDKFGHDVGDRVIIAICNVIEDNLRPSDMLCRWGGEEFVIILESSKTAKAYDICERIREKIERTKIDNIGAVTVSIGISTYELDDIYELLKRGDQALYHAKHLGRNQVVVKNKFSDDFEINKPV